VIVQPLPPAPARPAVTFHIRHLAVDRPERCTAEQR
jgi:hypothetical protein